MNWRIRVLQTRALPLGYGTIYKNRNASAFLFYFIGAGDEARTRYLHLGKVALYRMSYTREDMAYYSRNFRFVKHLFLFVGNFFLLLLFCGFLQRFADRIRGIVPHIAAHLAVFHAPESACLLTGQQIQM